MYLHIYEYLVKFDLIVKRCQFFDAEWTNHISTLNFLYIHAWKM